PLAVADEDDPPLGGVVRARGVTLADDVEVPLERDGRRVLPSRCRGDLDHEVATLVLPELEPVLLRPAADVLDHRLLVARRPREARQRLEMPPEARGLEPGEDGRVGCHSESSCLRALDAEDLLLLGLELLLAEDPLVLQLRELLELRRVVGLGRRSRSGLLRGHLLLRHLLLVGGLVLRSVLLVLPVPHRARGAGDDRCRGGRTDEPWSSSCEHLALSS